MGEIAPPPTEDETPPAAAAPAVPKPKLIAMPTVELSVPEGLPAIVRTDSEPERSYEPDEKPDHAAPAHLAIRFKDVEYDDRAFFDSDNPTIYVLPTRDMPKAMRGVQKRLTTLANVLKTKPTRFAGRVPFIPFMDAHFSFAERLQYMSFAGGEGVMFVGEIGVGIDDVQMDELLYVFQGLTSDGHHYILGVFPVETAVSMDKLAYVDTDSFEDNAKRAELHAQRAGKRVAKASAKRFTPRAAAMVKLFESLKITPAN